jgi:hypothetical protein
MCGVKGLDVDASCCFGKIFVQTVLFVTSTPLWLLLICNAGFNTVKLPFSFQALKVGNPKPAKGVVYVSA